jgi:hypothetical protein
MLCRVGDKNRRFLLFRRARFVAAAATGLGIATSCASSDGPRVCLSIAPEADEDTPVPPLGRGRRPRPAEGVHRDMATAPDAGDAGEAPDAREDGSESSDATDKRG